MADKSNRCYVLSELPPHELFEFILSYFTDVSKLNEFKSGAFYEVDNRKLF